MAKVTLGFKAPAGIDLAALRIYESASPAGPFELIERTTSIGSPPNYISEYVSDFANDLADWFAISWEDDDGTFSEMSTAVKGGTATILSDIVQRVMLRDSTLNEAVVIQEAEAAIESYLGTDPYATGLAGISYMTRTGLTYLVHARALLALRIISAGATQSATIGLVSMKAATSLLSNNVDIDALIAMANRLLGIATSFVMLLEEVQIGSSVTSWQYDQSRLVLEVGTE